MADRFVARPRLSGMRGTGIDQTADDVVLVTGPPGSGKTTLLAEWAQSLQRVGWVSLSEGDDSRSVWGTVLSTLPMLDLAVPAGGRLDLEFVSDFARAAEGLGEPVWVFLDEIEHLSGSDAPRSLSLLLRWPPSSLRFVLAGRFEPPLGLARLRMDGRLREVRAGELAFTRDEAVELLDGHGLRVDDRSMDALMELSEGWAAGLRLAAMALENGDDATELLAGFGSDHRAVADYLIGELFAHQSRREHGFMLDTSVCDELTPALAGELSGLDDAGEILDRLCRNNALTECAAGPAGTYRYHRLLRGYLLAELRRTQGDVSVARLHRAAARWYAAHDDLRRGVGHALAANDTVQVADLIEQAGPGLLLSGQAAELRALVEQVPPQLAETTSIRLFEAAAALDGGEIAEADAALHSVRTEDPRWAALHVALRVCSDRVTGAGNTALDDLEAAARAANDPDVDELAQLTAGATHLVHGAADRAEVALRGALDAATGHGHDYVALQCLAGLAATALSRGNLGNAGARAEAAIEFAGARGQEQTTACGCAYLVAGQVAYLRLDRDEADWYSSLSGPLLGDAGDPAVRFAATTLGAAVRFDRAVRSGTAKLADLRSYPASVREMWATVSCPLEPMWVVFAAEAYARMSLWVGETGWATEAVRYAAAWLGETGDVEVFRASVELHRGRVAAAQRCLAPLLSRDLACVSEISMVQAWLLDAVTADLGGDARRTHRALVEAARVAEPLHALRPFDDGGRGTRALLARYAGRFGRLEAFAHKILRAVPGCTLGPAERLSDRELEVLAELRSLRTSEEIATDLGVSVNTIKTHQRSIYRKFEVGTRRDAIAAARRLGLL